MGRSLIAAIVGVLQSAAAAADDAVMSCRPGATITLALALSLGVLAPDSVAGAAGSSRGAVPPDGVHVDVGDFYFSPATPTVGRGKTVVFDFVGDVTHTATDGSGLGLFDSGNVPPGGPSTSFTYVAAGVYAFVCTPHTGMGGRVSVPMRAAPGSGGRNTTFTLVWASSAASGDHVYDVQIHRPGRSWVSWRRGVTIRRDTFDPLKRGHHRFRARMRDVALDEASR